MIRYQITDGSASLAQLRPDVDFIQIREPRLTPRELADFVRAALRSAPGARILVNDRADIALACGAAGLHLRGHSVAPAVIRAIAPPGFVVTVACHDEADVRAAEGADYAILAPIFSPLSKADAREPLGLDALRRIARVSAAPVIALGGITDENTHACREAGAAGVAGITLFRRR